MKGESDRKGRGVRQEGGTDSCSLVRIDTSPVIDINTGTISFRDLQK